MTYGIFSLASGNVLESYTAEDQALAAVARISASEPHALAAVSVLAFDDHGDIVSVLDGDELVGMVREYEGAHHATPA